MKVHLSHLTRRILSIVFIASFMVGSPKPISAQAIRTANPDPIENLRSPAQRTQSSPTLPLIGSTFSYVT